MTSTAIKSETIKNTSIEPVSKTVSGKKEETEPEKKTKFKAYINPELAEKVFKKAKFYVEKLNFSVIPIAYMTKKPIIKWKEFQTRLPSHEELKSWFGEKVVLNIGLVTGKASRIVIIDVDDINQTPDWLKDIKTWIVKTNRGYHYYFRIREDEYIPTMHISPAVQLKAEGSYVLLPESLHPDGAIYKWKTFIKRLPEPASFDVVRDKVYELAKVNPNGNSLKSLRDLYFGVKEGERNVSLTRIAGSLYSDGLTPEEVYEVLRVVNERNEPPLPDREVRSIVRSIGKRNRKIARKEEELANYLSQKIVKYMNEDLLRAFEEAIRDFESFKQELSEKDRFFVEREFGKVVFSRIIKAVKLYSIARNDTRNVTRSETDTSHREPEENRSGHENS